MIRFFCTLSLNNCSSTYRFCKYVYNDRWTKQFRNETSRFSTFRSLFTFVFPKINHLKLSAVSPEYHYDSWWYAWIWQVQFCNQIRTITTIKKWIVKHIEIKHRLQIKTMILNLEMITSILGFVKAEPKIYWFIISIDRSFLEILSG